MTSPISFPNPPDLAADDYCVLGLATCFLREEGEFRQVQILEPIPSAALEAILKGVPTSYQWAWAQRLGELLSGDSPPLPAESPDSAQLCDRFAERVVAAARTYKARPEASAHIPLGTVRRDLNYSLERKRILNADHAVRTEDNVKQHPHTHQVL